MRENGGDSGSLARRRLRLFRHAVDSFMGANTCNCITPLGVAFTPRTAVIDASSLPRLCTSGEVSQSQLSKGLRRVADNVGDLCLDNPAARAQLEEVVKVGMMGVQAVRESADLPAGWED